MADKENTFLNDMIGKKGRTAKPAAASEPISNRVNPKPVVSNPYDVQSYGILKMRLSDQNTQIQEMTDYSEDSAIKLNDIYEILREMKPQSHVSTLDEYFKENGYIPVKVLNPCCDEEGNPIGGDKTSPEIDTNPNWGDLIVGALGLAMQGLGIYSELTDGSNGQPSTTTPANTTESTAGTDAAPSSYVAPANPNITTNVTNISYVVTPAADNSTSVASTDTGTTSTQGTPKPVAARPETPRRRKPRDGADISSVLSNFLKDMRGYGSIADGSNTTGTRRDAATPVANGTQSATLINYGITRDNTDNTTMSARKINFIAKEITYDADKFEFINKSLTTASTNSIGGNGTELASFNPNGADTPMGSVSGSNFSTSNHGQMTARESSVLDVIANREGVGGEQGYDMILGDRGKPGTSPLGVPPKPITEMNLNELYAWQTTMLKNPLNKELYGEASSAVGAGQFVRTTLFGKDGTGGLIAQMGITPDMWGDIKFDKKLQDMLTLKNFRNTVGDPNKDPSTWNMQGLANQWESFKFKPLSLEELSSIGNTGVNPVSKGPHNDIFELSASTATTLDTPQKITAGVTPISYSPQGGVQSPMGGRSFQEPLTATIEDMFDKLLNDTLMYTV